MNRLFTLRSLGYEEAGNDIWFANLYFNGLVRVNKATGRIEDIHKFPGHAVSRDWLYSTVYSVKDSLVFIPNTSGEIAAYSMETGEFALTPLDPAWIGKKKTYFASAYRYKDYVYLFPLGAKCMVRYDANDHSVKYLDNCIRELLEALPETSYGLYQQFEVVEGKIYMPFLEKNAVAVFDPGDESAEIRYLDIEGGCSTINYIDGFFYLASWNRPEIYRWNMETGEILTYKGFPEDTAGGKIFLYACYMEEFLLFFPEQREWMLSLSVKTGEMRRLKQIYNPEEEGKNTFFVKETEEGICILASDMENPHLLSYERGRIGMKPICRLDRDYNQNRICDYLLKEGYYNGCLETEKGLKSFVEVITGAGDISQAEEKRPVWGEKTFRRLKEIR